VELRPPHRLLTVVRPAAGGLAALIAALALATPALGADLEVPKSPTKPPPGYELTARKVERIARATESVKGERDLHRDLHATAYTSGSGRWQVSWFSGGKERAQVIVEDSTGRVVEQWTGPQVAWKMARGYPGAFGRKLNAPYVWIPLCLLFLLPFVDPRRPFRLIHLDLLVLVAGFGLSHYFFNRGEISASVPLAYLPLIYLMARALWEGFRPRTSQGRLVPIVPIVWLAVATLFLVGFRIALNVADSNVIDVGYAGVIGADRIADGKGVYGDGFHDDVESGDTYGPVNYLAYVPFEQAMSWGGSWDELEAAHGAAIAFDLAVLLGLFVLGRRLRPGVAGRELGWVLAFAWAALPYSTFALETNANDSLVAAFLVWALVAIASPAGRGALLALATATKFAPLLLAPLFARGADDALPRRSFGRGIRGAAIFLVALAAVTTLVFVPFLPDGGLAELFGRTVGYQTGRESPFSIWGQVPGIDWLHTAVKVGAVALAVLVAFVPRRRGTVQVAALAAAVLIAVQLTASHWFYLYIPWFAPLLLAALFAPYQPTRRPAEALAA
jgi:glycosyl transferase family 87